MYSTRLLFNAQSLETALFTESDNSIQEREEFLQLTYLSTCIFLDMPSPRLLAWLYDRQIKTGLLDYYELESRPINEGIYNWKKLKEIILYNLYPDCEKMVLSYVGLTEDLTLRQRADLYYSLEWLLNFRNTVCYSKEPDFFIKENMDKLINRVEKVISILTCVYKLKIS